MGLETIALVAGIIGLFILLMRMSRFQMAVMETLETLGLLHRAIKVDTLDIFYSFREINKGLKSILERESEIIDMINQIESQEADIEKAFQAVFAGVEDLDGKNYRGPAGPPSKPQPKPESEKPKSED